jgi:hypothetical protein
VAGQGEGVGLGERVRSPGRSRIEPAHRLASDGAETGNDFEVDFIQDYRILHDAGHHVLTYDERNSGHGGPANGPVNRRRGCRGGGPGRVRWCG